MKWKIPLFKMYYDNNDIKNVVNILKRGSYWSSGQEIEEFEKEITHYMGTKYCVAVNSGTSALHAALLAHKIGPGDEVIVPSFTFIATVNAPLFVSAKPVFADIEEKTFGLNPIDVQEKITSRTKAILCVHYGGCPSLIRELREIVEDYHLLLIEDAAEALGAKICDKYVGTFGETAILSFCQNKIITTGEGGAIITDSKEVYKRLKLIRSHGRSEKQDYFSSIEHSDYVSLGYNLRMPTINAALGLSQIKKIDKIIKMRRAKAEFFSKNLSKIMGIKLIMLPYCFFHVYQMYTIRTNKRDELMQYLANNGIMTKVYFDPVHLTSFYKNTLGYRIKLPVTETISKEVLSLPIYPGLKKAEMEYIVTKIKNFMVSI